SSSAFWTSASPSRMFDSVSRPRPLMVFSAEVRPSCSDSNMASWGRNALWDETIYAAEVTRGRANLGASNDLGGESAAPAAMTPLATNPHSIEVPRRLAILHGPLNLGPKRGVCRPTEPTVSTRPTTLGRELECCGPISPCV